MCGSAARTELYGGQLAIAVPTVTGITGPFVASTMRLFGMVLGNFRLFPQLLVPSMSQ